jgi:hypothetical protein
MTRILAGALSRRLQVEGSGTPLARVPGSPEGAKCRSGTGGLVALYVMKVSVALVPDGFALAVGESLHDNPAQSAAPALVDPGDLERANGRIVASQ